MKHNTLWQKIRFFRLRKQLKIRFPLYCKLHGVSKPDYQGALAQSEVGDGLQLVHAPLDAYPHNTYAYSITLNRILGYLDGHLAEKLVRLFGERFCCDGEICNITGGEQGDYFGCNIRIYPTRTMMKDIQDFSHLYS